MTSLPKLLPSWINHPILSAVSAGLLTASIAVAAERPNVVFIVADDLDWSDTTLYGTTKLYQTPNIERLAASPSPAFPPTPAPPPSNNPTVERGFQTAFGALPAA